MLIDTSLVAADNLTWLARALEETSPIKHAEEEPVGATVLAATTTGGYRLALALGHNVAGWEAVIDHETSNQTPLLDGPGPDASIYEVASWAAAQADAFERALDVRSALETATTALWRAVSIWQEADPAAIGHLLDEGFPFPASLDDFAASVGAYTDAVEQRLLP
jgi:hypothetical protein